MATQQKMREDSKVFQVISSVHNLMNEWQNSGGQDQLLEDQENYQREQVRTHFVGRRPPGGPGSLMEESSLGLLQLNN